MGQSLHPGQACAKNARPDDPVPGTGTPWRWWHSRTLKSSGTHSSCLQLASPCLYIGTFPGSQLCSSYSRQVVPTCLWVSIPRPQSTKPGIHVMKPWDIQNIPFLSQFFAGGSLDFSFCRGCKCDFCFFLHSLLMGKTGPVLTPGITLMAGGASMGSPSRSIYSLYAGGGAKSSHSPLEI